MSALTAIIELLQKYNPNHEPAGSPKGGQFARKAGSGYSLVNGSWQKRDGTKASAATLERLRLVGAASPGYRDIQLNPDPKGYLQAYVTDAKGRVSRKYSADYTHAQKQAKFLRNEAFHKARPAILQDIENTLRRTTAPPKEWESAFVLKMIDETGFRPGSDKNTKAEKKAYGATNMLAKQVTIDGDKISFSFVGKKGVKLAKTLRHPGLARELKARKAAREPGERLFGVSGSDLKSYLIQHGHGKFMPKDFRTWNGTNKAIETMKKMPVPKTQQAYKQAVKKVSTVVGAHLGNTPAMAYNSYINPRVWSKWPIPQRGKR